MGEQFQVKTWPGKFGTRPTQFVYSLLQDPTGSAEMAVSAGAADSGSVGTLSAVGFTYTCPTGCYTAVERVNMIGYEPGISPNEFLGLTSLTTGIKIGIYDSTNTRILDFLGGRTIVRHHDFSLLAGIDSEAVNTTPANDDAWHSRWTIAKAGDSLRLYPGEQFMVLIRDDISALTSFQMMLQGIKYSMVP